jgi:Sulfotransferase domain
MAQPRFPDYVVIGAMKSGTTSLHTWLGDQPECWVHPRWKEPQSFTARWRRGPAWYRELFREAPADALAGEASSEYTSPRWAGVAARRMRETVPDARIIYVVRHPVERLRSHYRHQVQRGRESAPLLEAVSRPGNDYVGFSMYHACLAPYIHAFPSEQILVIRTEDLDGSGWHAVLRHLGLADRPAPGDVRNVTREKAGYGRLMLTLWERRLIPRASWVPKPARRVARRILLHDTSAYRQHIEESEATLPDRVLEPLWADLARLETWEGRGPLWEPATEPFVRGGR